METNKYRYWIMGLLIFLCGAVVYGISLLNSNVTDIKILVNKVTDVSSDQALFRDNFSNYMNCLIVNEEEVVIEVGEEAYVEICKQLLYLGIDPIPPTIKADPNLLTTTTTSPKASE